MKDVVLRLPFDVTETLTMVSVESLNYAVEDWFELRFGKLTLVHIRCWAEENDRMFWQLFWPGIDCYLVNNVMYADPVSAAHFFYLEHITNGKPCAQVR